MGLGEAQQRKRTSMGTRQIRTFEMLARGRVALRQFWALVSGANLISLRAVLQFARSSLTLELDSMAYPGPFAKGGPIMCPMGLQRAVPMSDQGGLSMSAQGPCGTIGAIQ
eukprot:4482485-Pyramimonas_sp.AAC.1